ncbi:MAG: error-prone DNA polymerase [Deltaproteobacteria bacterium]|nr:error-prone DNA polymerase [Deltaproteobacteria bacterium]
MTRFAELLGRSCFSFLEGASHPRELCERSQALGHEAIALCDRDGLYGSVRMHEAARELGHPIIVGAELTLELDPPHPYAQSPRPSIALLAESHAGYSALCRLLTQAHADHEKGEAGITIESVVGEGTGLFAIVPLEPEVALTAEQLDRIREAFGERCAIATWRRLDATDGARLQLARDSSKRHDMPIVVSSRPLYHHRNRKPLADVVHCIRRGVTLEEAGTILAPNAEATLKSAPALRRLFPDNPEWLERSATIAERCDFQLDELHYNFPCEPMAGPDGRVETLPGAGTPDERLRDAVETGLVDRYGKAVPPDVRQQIEKELGLIAELEVAPYFLSVKQIVDIARARSILCQGRGSAANSAVCYVLGITAVDPVRGSLLFERFMSTARQEPPDIDVDFEHERREEVIQEIYQRYGRERAAMVCEVIRYRGKSALRQVGKVFGLATDQLDRLSSIASHFTADGEVSSRALSKRGLDPDDRGLRQVVELATELEGFPRHLSVHVGGFVLSSEPLHRIAPIEPARMEGRTVIPWDKDDMAILGFFKVDVLGLGMLTAIRKAQALLHELSGQPGDAFDPITALAQIPAEDPAVYDAVCQADTVGVFQIESRAQMAMLPILKPRAFYDLVVEVGIVRPGPIQGKMVHPYLRRRTGEEPIRYPHPSLEPILERTLGVPLFQEQVMQIAIVGAGYDPGEADQLRRDMAAWRRNGRLARHRDKLLDGFRDRGVPVEFGERLYQQIQGFGEYGFPESHAASFALLVYASAWLKVHHQAAFTCALINAQPLGFYTPASLIRDAQKHDVEVRPVRINVSLWDCSLEPPGPALRLGFRLVRGLGDSSVEKLMAARAERAFTGIDDFVLRSGLRRDEVEVLAEAGAFEDLIPSRREALWRIRAPRENGLFAGRAIEPDEPVGLPPISAPEQLSLDYSSVGVSLDDHPVAHLGKQLKRRRVLKAETQTGWKKNQQVTVAGVVLARQRPKTANGVVFLTLEDDTGTVNVVLYPRVFEAYELVARHAGIMLARGRIDRRGDVVHLRAAHLERLDMPQGGSLTLRSRDFH